MKIAIRSRFTGAVLVEMEAPSMKAAVEKAVARQLSLAGADLRNEDFRKGELGGVDFRGADLRNADFSGAIMTGARMNSATCAGTKFVGTLLEGADMRNADLSNAVMTGAKMTRTNLFNVRAPHAVMTRATLTNAKMGASDWTSVQFHGADLNGAEVDDRTCFRGAEFTAANMTNMALEHVDLSEVVLHQAIFATKSEVAATLRALPGAKTASAGSVAGRSSSSAKHSGSCAEPRTPPQTLG
jgi:uncharacterized protein YjbI with pentapeptide repeats